MIVNGISLIFGGIFGFILGIALVKEHYGNECHRLQENIIRLEYDVQIAKYKRDNGGLEKND
ncbi:hypothetical protein [Methanobrevibacter sp.]|uniref:hypothetical protein n=1 Tax=Methanobrevibacter sp. TaxID=66852 RepID=UPI0025FE39F0|nr:hypothetical protein [Methanobrevibacter sp.]MBQ2832383.1 hypothetical protein [Methanobrevibacter sp.]